MPLLHRTALAVALLAVAPLASAAQSADFQVSIEINNACDITATDMTFPAATSLASGTTATSTVSVECSSQGPIHIAFNKGTTPGASLAARKMTDGTNTIDYSLYRADNALLGDGTTESSVTIDATSTGGTDDFIVQGRVPAQGPKPVGSYTDTITASVTF